LKIVDSAVLREKSRIPSRNGSDRKRIPSQDLQENISRDTKLAVERELTNSKLLFSFRDRHRTRLDPESGQAVLDLLDPTLDYAYESHLAKGSTGVFTALNRETRLEQF
jgi:hypothetical protein